MERVVFFILLVESISGWTLPIESRPFLLSLVMDHQNNLVLDRTEYTQEMRWEGQGRFLATFKFHGFLRQYLQQQSITVATLTQELTQGHLTYVSFEFQLDPTQSRIFRDDVSHPNLISAGMLTIGPVRFRELMCQVKASETDKLLALFQLAAVPFLNIKEVFTYLETLTCLSSKAVEGVLENPATQEAWPVFFTLQTLEKDEP